MVKLFQKIIVLFLVFLITACSKKPYTVYEGMAMTMSYKVIIGERITDFTTSLVSSKINEIFHKTHEKFNNWNPASEISKINDMPSKQKMLVSEELFDLLEHTQSIVTLTNGLFDPTISPLKELWLSKLKFGLTPSSSELKALEPAIGFHNIVLDREFLTIMKEHDQTKIDLCGISKGHTVDLIAEALDNLKIHNYYLEWGGEIRTLGKHPSGRSWQIIPIKTLDKTIAIQKTAIASSGNYLQNWSVGGVTYTHIIHPKTKKPLVINKESIQATTVIHEKCSTADALATTLMLFNSVKEAQEWALQYNIKAYIKGADALN